MALTKGKKTEAPPRVPVRVHGWGSPEQVAYDISGGLHDRLLQGHFVFAARPATGEVKELVVSRRGPDTWMYGITTTGWTGLVPGIGRSGILETLVPLLTSKKVDGDIVQDLIHYINE